MLILGHAGITLGAAVVLSGVADSSKPQTASNKNSLNSHSSLLSRPTEWLTLLSGKIDLRFPLLGTLLPDIIDKPLGYIFFREALSSDRTAAHSLLFLVSLALAGW